MRLASALCHIGRCSLVALETTAVCGNVTGEVSCSKVSILDFCMICAVKCQSDSYACVSRSVSYTLHLVLPHVPACSKGPVLYAYVMVRTSHSYQQQQLRESCVVSGCRPSNGVDYVEPLAEYQSQVNSASENDAGLHLWGRPSLVIRRIALRDPLSDQHHSYRRWLALTGTAEQCVAVKPHL